MRFRVQRWLGFSLVIIFAAAALWLLDHFAASVPRMAYLTGWALFAVILLLTLYNGRKKVPFVPLLSSEAWLQFHIYAGLLTGVLFAIHLNYRVPHGWFEATLAWLYLLVMISGVWGLILSRRIPKRLTTRGGEVLFERIPAIRRRLQDETEQLALQSVSASKSATIADFYLRELKHFFDRPKNMVLHLIEVRSPVNQILTKITDVQRYLNQEERVTMEKIAVLVRQKDGLDYHHALQLVLKLWLFIHIPLTYSLLLFTFAHIILVFAFSGGAR
jgi:hypothetical protein